MCDKKHISAESLIDIVWNKNKQTNNPEKKDKE